MALVIYGIYETGRTSHLSLMNHVLVIFIFYLITLINEVKTHVTCKKRIVTEYELVSSR